MIGLWVGRVRVLQEARAHRRGFTVVAAIGATAAIVGDALTNSSGDVGGEAGRAIWMASNFGVTAFYVAVTALVGGARRADSELIRSFASSSVIDQVA